MKLKFKIHRGVRIPSVQHTVAAAGVVYPFDDMDVGDMFFVQHAPQALTVYASKAGRELKRKFATRAISTMLVNNRLRIVEPGVRGAMTGVGVWRVE